MKNVLLVDDEAIVRIGLKTCVNWESLGIREVYEASNGAEALDIIRNTPIDILITDIKMSVMDGFSMLDALKEQQHSPKVIIMSCYNDYETMHRAILYGVKDFLFKPKMYPADIEHSIRTLFESSRNSISAPEELIAHMSPDRYAEDFSQLIELLKAEAFDAAEIVKCVNLLIIKLMEFDTPAHPALHTLCSLLFQKLYELKKMNSKEDCISLLSTICQQQAAPTIKERLSKALSFIDLHISDANLSQEMVAEQIGLSPSYFCRLFKTELQIGYSSYIIKKRIELADQLLASTNMKISDIALAVGYTNEQYFSRLYKDYTGHNMRSRQ